MRRVTSILPVAIGVAAAAVLCACSHAPPVPGGVAHETLADCPNELRERVRVSASAVPIALPDGLSSQLIARRLLISSSLINTAAAVHVRGSTLNITTVGGTFAGYGRVVGVVLPSRGRALEIIPGRLRVEPFLFSPELRAQTIALDVILTPGGAPADKVTLSVAPLWTSDRQAVAPDALQINTSAERHLTVFDVVEAH